MASQIYKSPLEQAKSLYERGEISRGELDDVAIAEFEKKKQNPSFDKQRVLNFLENYGDHMTDDAYLDFAKAKGITPGAPDQKRGYYNEYITNENFLKHVNDEKEKAGEWDDYEFAGIDGDYERSYGPVTNGEQYDAYLKWLKEGK